MAIKEKSKAHQQFIEFCEVCRRDNEIYSVKDAAKAVGTNIAALRSWRGYGNCLSDNFMSLAKYRCSLKAGNAYSNGLLTKELAERYLKENGMEAGELEKICLEAKEKVERVERRRVLMGNDCANEFFW